MSDLYIQNLTDNLIGKNCFDRMWKDHYYHEGVGFFKHVRNDLLCCADVSKMSPETLGKIMCAFEVGDVVASKKELFDNITFSGDCEEMLRELVAVCLAHVIVDRLNPDTPGRFAKYRSPEIPLERSYRIRTWRTDVPTQTHSTPTFQGRTEEECDQKALAHFRTVSNKAENAWEGMDIVRIDAPATTEKITFLEKNGRQEG